MAQPEKQPWVTFGKEEGQNRNLSGMTQQITEKGHNKNKNKKNVEPLNSEFCFYRRELAQ